MNLKKKIKQEFQQEFQQKNQTNLQFETIASQNGFIKKKTVFHRNGYKIATCMLSLLLLICLGLMIIQDAKGKNKANNGTENTNPSLIDNNKTDDSTKPPLIDDDKVDETESNNGKQTITNEEIEQKAQTVDQIIKDECANAPTLDTPNNLGGLNIQDIITWVFVGNINSIQNKGEISIYDENHTLEGDSSTPNKEKIYFYISKIKNTSGEEEEHLMIKANTNHDYQMKISYQYVEKEVTLVSGKIQTIGKISFDATSEVKVTVSLYLDEKLVDTYDIVIKR